MKTRTDVIAILGILAVVLVAGFGCGDDPQDTSDDAGLGQDIGEQDAGEQDAASDPGDEDAGADVGDEDAGDDDGGGDTGGDSLSYDQMWQVLEQAHGCGNGYCHGGGSAPAIIGYDALVDQESDCDDSLLVVPGDPEASLLWRKIAPEIAAEDVCGDKMAPQSAVSQEMADDVYRWIADGAKR